jgi:hypothetical protein
MRAEIHRASMDQRPQRRTIYDGVGETDNLRRRRWEADEI